MYSFLNRGFCLLRVYLVQHHFTPKINMHIIHFLKLKTYYQQDGFIHQIPGLWQGLY